MVSRYEKAGGSFPPCLGRSMQFWANSVSFYQKWPIYDSFTVAALMCRNDLNLRFLQLCADLQMYQLKFTHIRGSQNAATDCLSRNPVDDPEDVICITPAVTETAKQEAVHIHTTFIGETPINLRELQQSDPTCKAIVSMMNK